MAKTRKNTHGIAIRFRVLRRASILWCWQFQRRGQPRWKVPVPVPPHLAPGAVVLHHRVAIRNLFGARAWHMDALLPGQLEPTRPRRTRQRHVAGTTGARRMYGRYSKRQLEPHLQDVARCFRHVQGVRLHVFARWG